MSFEKEIVEILKKENRLVSKQLVELQDWKEELTARIKHYETTN